MTNPYAPPRSEPLARPTPVASLPTPARFAYSLGHLLVVERRATLPDACIKCASRQEIERVAHTYRVSPDWALWTMLLGCFWGPILFLAVQKTAPQSVPLCAECAPKWRGAVLHAQLALAATVASPFVAFGALAFGTGTTFALALLGAVGSLASFLWIRNRRVRLHCAWATSITTEQVTLDGVDWNVLAFYDEAARAWEAQVKAEQAALS